MKIYIGADHRGFELKKSIVDYLEKHGYQTVDVGTFQEDVGCDYPEFSLKVATKVVGEADARGILVCMTGIGHCIAANKIPGAYAALCYSKEAAALSREHNNSNILVLGSLFIKDKSVIPIVETWLTTKFEGGRHQRRFEQIKEIEKKFLK